MKGAEEAGTDRGGRRRGCLAISALAGLVAAALLALFGVAYLQNRSAVVERREFDEQLPSIDASGRTPSAPGRVVLDLSVVQATIVPGPPGSAIHVEASYDPSTFELVQEMSENLPGSGWTARIGLHPRGSEAWALLRMKVGGDPARIRITLPGEVAIVLEGRVAKGFAAMELGGLWLRSSELSVEGGAVELSFIEPLREPMERLAVHGTGGALEVTQLGNASPRMTLLEQRFGALDLDLRGEWVTDAVVQIDARAAGGSLWLPRDVFIEGSPSVRALRSSTELPGAPHPSIRIEMTDRSRNILVID